MYKKTFKAFGKDVGDLARELISDGWKETDAPYLLITYRGEDGHYPEEAFGVAAEWGNVYVEQSANCFTNRYDLHSQQRNIFMHDYDLFTFRYINGTFIVYFSKNRQFSPENMVIDSEESWKAARLRYEASHGTLMAGVLVSEIMHRPPLIRGKKFAVKLPFFICVGRQISEFADEGDILLAKQDFVAENWLSPDIHDPTELGGKFPQDFEPQFYMPIIRMQLRQLAIDLAMMGEKMIPYPQTASAFMLFDVYLIFRNSSAVLIDRIEEGHASSRWFVGMINKATQFHSDKQTP